MKKINAANPRVRVIMCGTISGYRGKWAVTKVTTKTFHCGDNTVERLKEKKHRDQAQQTHKRIKDR